MTLEDLLSNSKIYEDLKKDWQQYSEDWGFDEECINQDFYESAFYEKIYNFLTDFNFIYFTIIKINKRFHIRFVFPTN